MEYIVKLATSTVDRKKALEIRKIVFVEEQKVPQELEYDAYDEQASVDHFIVSTEFGKVVGTARLRAYDPKNGKVQRVAILAEYRGMGAGALLMRAVEKTAQEKGFQKLKLEAQVQARRFYEHLGYQTQGSVFWDANIEHINMTKEI